MALFDTGSDLVAYVQRRAGDILPTRSTPGTTDDRYLDAKGYVQQAYWDLCAMRPWRWCRKRVQFVSPPASEVAVLSIVGATVTLSAALAATQAGRKFYMNAESIPHRIQAHTAATAVLTLATAYTGTVGAGAATIFQDEVTVAPDILAFPRVKELHTGDDLEVVPEAELDKMAPRNILHHVRATYGAFIGPDTLRIVPHTTATRLFECAYNYRPVALTFDANVATDTPIVPQQRRITIGDYALVRLYTDKRDGRRTQAEADVSLGLQELSGTEISFGKPRTYVRPGQSIGGGTGRGRW
jgi:hypothetical protein